MRRRPAPEVPDGHKGKSVQSSSTPALSTSESKARIRAKGETPAESRERTTSRKQATREDREPESVMEMFGEPTVRTAEIQQPFCSIRSAPFISRSVPWGRHPAHRPNCAGGYTHGRWAIRCAARNPQIQLLY